MYVVTYRTMRPGFSYIAVYRTTEHLCQEHERSADTLRIWAAAGHPKAKSEDIPQIGVESEIILKDPRDNPTAVVSFVPDLA